MIRLEEVSLRREEKQILSDINIHMKRGEQWVILGKNGSGKTTLLEMINGYMFPSQGTVDVLGYRYGTVDLREVRKEIGYMGQSLLEKLNFADPVWEVVATGEYAFLRFYQTIPNEVIDKAQRMLEELQISHLSNQPLGLLSQGERKKVLLARAMMMNPKLLILDEACAGLDLYEREKLLQGITNFAGYGVQMVYVTHHIEEIIPIFTHVALLDQGRLAAAGPKHDVLTADMLQRVYQIPVIVDWHQDRPWIRVTLG
ncbi:MAG: ATP-binding cassette domain-containing protein [Paenibacillaceae bacterium]